MKIKIKKIKHKYLDELTVLDMIKLLFFVAIVSGIIFHFNSLMPSAFAKLTMYISIISGYGGILLFILFYKGDKRNNSLFYPWICIVIYMAVVGYINSNGFAGATSKYWLFTQDIRYVMYFLMAIICTYRKFSEYMEFILKFICLMAVILGIVGLLNYNFNDTLIAQRNGIWSLPYYCWWLSTTCFAYGFAHAYITGKDKIIGYGSFFVYIVLGLLFLKRSVLVNGIVIILISSALKNKVNYGNNIDHILKNVRNIILGLFILICVYKIMMLNPYFNQVLQQLLLRFGSEQNYENLDRTIESTLYFQSASMTEIIMGQGLGSYVVLEVPMTIVVNALHIGLANIVYKGGIFYSLFYLCIFIGVIKKVFNDKNMSEKSLVCLCVSLSLFISLLYEMSWTFTILIFPFGYCLAYLFQKEKG